MRHTICGGPRAHVTVCADTRSVEVHRQADHPSTRADFGVD
ncbi:hypothetical protein [Neoroseomonas terrae]|nr:hypothetical protein [Neoroseomonas terrae]